MKKVIVAFAFTLLHFGGFAQSDFDVSKDKETGAVIYKGECTFDDLKKEPTFGWFDKKAKAYEPDSVQTAYLKKNLKNYELIVLLGTWCEDSQNLVPKLYKTLQKAEYPLAQLKMYGVDRAKETKNIESKLYKVERVPTIIVRINGNEIGRIVESVKENIETDLAIILHHYLND